MNGPVSRLPGRLPVVLPGRLPGRGSLFARLALRTAAASFGFFLVAGASVVVVSARTVTDQVEGRMTAVASTLDRLPAAALADPAVLCRLVTEQAPAGPRAEVFVEVTAPDGTTCRPAGAPTLAGAQPPPRLLARVIGTDLPQVVPAGGAPLLVIDRELPGGGTARVGGDLTDFTTLARRLWTTLLALAVPGALIAVGVGSVLTRDGLRPVTRLTAAAERIAATGDLSVPVDVPAARASDEVARLARAFRAMTAALARARERQAQLVADVGHELRTPLTSLRTNLELLVRSERSGRALPAGQREALLADVTGQLDELSHLVSELVVLAHDEPARPRADVRLDDVVDRAVQRARRRAAGHRVELTTVPCVVPAADAAGLERAVLNLVDNAVKFSPAGSTVTVALAAGPGGTVRVTVDDEGPGVPADHREDAFERFWRADDARALPGSGLGLAIVADAAEQHGGTARLADAPGGGTRAVLELPGAPAHPDGAPSPDRTPSGAP